MITKSGTAHDNLKNLINQHTTEKGSEEWEERFKSYAPFLTGAKRKEWEKVAGEHFGVEKIKDIFKKLNESMINFYKSLAHTIHEII